MSNNKKLPTRLTNVGKPISNISIKLGLEPRTETGHISFSHRRGVVPSLQLLEHSLACALHVRNPFHSLLRDFEQAVVSSKLSRALDFRYI